jgi:hypothetical protein
MPKRSLKRRRSKRVRNSRRYLKKGGVGIEWSTQKCNTKRVNDYITQQQIITKNEGFGATASQYCIAKTGGDYDSCDKNGQMNTGSEDRTPYCYRIQL